MSYLSTQARLSYIDLVLRERQARSRSSEHCSNWMEALLTQTVRDAIDQ